MHGVHDYEGIYKKISRFATLCTIYQRREGEDLAVPRMSSSQFWDRIEFDMPKTLDTALQKARLCYEHGQLR